MLLEINGDSFDLSSVCYVGAVGGDSSWRSYIIEFDNGHTREIFDTRAQANGRPLRQMKREDLHKLWVKARFGGKGAKK